MIAPPVINPSMTGLINPKCLGLMSKSNASGSVSFLIPSLIDVYIQKMFWISWTRFGCNKYIGIRCYGASILICTNDCHAHPFYLMHLNPLQSNLLGSIKTHTW
ncbi:hypothetical protein BHE74_00009916 [Ensete ventricosum]|nr:hypothetical protein GW17_00059152 [Ensete ventricosum]RWW81664.1 hypothetical protein BHE74_00009916 [Ensete ventricosum]RZR88123.1 hypothetical protein BHM03_00015691 [Ensete ventricosum]